MTNRLNLTTVLQISSNGQSGADNAIPVAVDDTDMNVLANDTDMNVLANDTDMNVLANDTDMNVLDDDQQQVVHARQRDNAIGRTTVVEVMTPFVLPVSWKDKE